MILSGHGFLNPSHTQQNMNNFFALLCVLQLLKSYMTGLGGLSPAFGTLFLRFVSVVVLLFLSCSCNSAIPLLKIQMVLTYCLQLESNGIGCDPDSSQEVDHTVVKPNIVYHWGLISQANTQIDTDSLKEDFMIDVVNDVYGNVKCIHSELTMSIVGPSELPKSTFASDSFYSQHLPRHMVAYRAATDCWSAVG